VRTLDYVILYVADLDRALGFYRTLLGVEGERRSETYAEIRLANAKLGFYLRDALPDLIGRPGGSGPDAPDAEVLFVVDDVDAQADRLRVAGVRILTGPVDRPWGHRTLHLEDPDGHLVELAQEIVRSS
jgi:lactoylglutathione lyase